MALSGCVALLASAACAAPAPVDFPDGGGGVVATVGPDTAGPLTFRGTELVDAHGRVVQLHGINMVRKTAPFHVSPDEAGFAENIERIRRSGFNAVRLGVRLDALMPAPGVVDEDYLTQVERGVDALVEANLWVLLDFHQDVFDGMPTWATTPAAAALSPTIPGLGDGFWALAYFSPRSTRQWEDLYRRVRVAEGRSAVDWIAEGVAAVAQRFAANPNIVGIDLMNEPWPGAAFGACATSSCARRYEQLQSIFEQYTAAVREVAPAMNVWWAPFNFGPPYQNHTPPSDDRVGFAYHSYCLYTDGGRPVRPNPLEHNVCGALYATQTDDAQRAGRRWDTPVLLGEFGASASPLNTTTLTRLADDHQMSWMYWDDNYYRTAPDEVRTDLVRTYPQATAGTVLSQRFEPATGSFELRYRPDSAATAPTTVVVPTEVYPNGYEVTVEGGTVTSAPDAGRLSVVADPAAVTVTLAVTRRP